MSEDSFHVKTPIVSMGVTRKEHILEVEEGQSYLIRAWNWRKFGFIYKLLTVKDGELIVKVMRR